MKTKSLVRRVSRRTMRLRVAPGLGFSCGQGEGLHAGIAGHAAPALHPVPCLMSHVVHANVCLVSGSCLSQRRGGLRWIIPRSSLCSTSTKRWSKRELAPTTREPTMAQLPARIVSPSKIETDSRGPLVLYIQWFYRCAHASSTATTSCDMYTAVLVLCRSCC